ATGLRRVASSGPAAPLELEPFLLRHLANAQLDQAKTDQTLDVTCQTGFGKGDATLEPLLLSAGQGERRVQVAVVALHFSRSRRWPPPEVLEALARQLSALTNAAGVASLS
ncbi:MAG TPA: hypothetical protein VFZ61_17190, partial [Polyangiales bacterium]